MSNPHVYWEEHGALWHVLYEKRPKQLFYYRIQELILRRMIALLRPSSALEYGCGTGRILKALRSLPGLTLYGVDQSSTMIAQIANWCDDQEWLRQNIALVDGVNPRIPHPDSSIELVFSNEALLHTPAETLPNVLDELARVASKFVVHIEPIYGEPLEADDHAGCFAHDYEALYRERGFKPVIRQNVVGQQSLIIVPLQGNISELEWLESELAYLQLLNAEVQSNYDSQTEMRTRLEEAKRGSQPGGNSSLANGRPQRRALSNVHGFNPTAHAAVQNIKAIHELSSENRRLGRELQEEREYRIQLSERLQDTEALRHWRPYRWGTALRNSFWRIRSRFERRAKSLRIDVNATPTVTIEKVLRNSHSVPYFLLIGHDAVDRLDPTGRVVLRRGTLELFGGDDWTIVFAPIPFDGQVNLTVGASSRQVDFASLEQTGFAVHLTNGAEE